MVVELLTAMALVGTGCGPGHPIQNDVGDRSSPDAVRGVLSSRTGNVILVIGGTSLDADAIELEFYERGTAVVEAC